MSWTVTKWNGSAFAADTALDNPWSVEFSKVTTEQIEKLADGDEGSVIPTTKSWQEIALTWGSRAAAMRTQLEGYVDNANILKLTDLKSNTYCGRFTAIRSTETGGTILYDISATFRQVVDPT